MNEPTIDWSSIGMGKIVPVPVQDSEPRITKLEGIMIEVQEVQESDWSNSNQTWIMWDNVVAVKNWGEASKILLRGGHEILVGHTTAELFEMVQEWIGMLFGNGGPVVSEPE